MQDLNAYVQLRDFKDALGIPKNQEIFCALLAQGEYNINYLFVHPVTREKMILRVNTKSQMHLAHQIEYEYHALKLLEDSGRTPHVFYVDGTCKHLDYGVLVMEYLSGRPLNYHTDMQLAAQCLADIHSTPIPSNHSLISPTNPLQAILTECHEMIQIYNDSPLADGGIKKKINGLLEMGQKKLDTWQNNTGYQCCVNTELNSGNFLINGVNQPNYLIDWEKPLYGDPVQDLGHILAPTTTFWKTDVILDCTAISDFLMQYQTAVGNRFDTSGLREKLDLFIPITCLRGITWCAMAWVEYQDETKLIRNADTFDKIKQYITEDFLDMIVRNFFMER